MMRRRSFLSTVCFCVISCFFFSHVYRRLIMTKPKASQTARDTCPCEVDPEEIQHDVAIEMETNEDVLIPFFWSQGLQVRAGVGRRREVLDPELELPLFRYPPLHHLQCLPDHSKSQVHMINPQTHYFAGDTVQFRIDLHNGCGKLRPLGGDEIRAWLKSSDGQSSVAAKVTDLHNGSYVGETVLKWTGVSLVRVSLTYPREFLREVLELHHTLHTLRWTTHSVTSGTGVKETVPCLPSAPIPGYTKTCNFTDINGGRPWFCGHPVTKGFNCSHLLGLSNLPNLSPLPIPQPLKDYVTKLDKCCVKSRRHPDLRLINNDIKINTDEGRPAPPLPPCWTNPARDSWQSPAPRGWLEKGEWLSSTCALPKLSPERVKRCMQNRTLLLLGDSNQRLVWFRIKELMSCDTVAEAGWNAPHLCQNSELNSTVLFVTHALPFSVGTRIAGTISNLPLPLALQRALHYSSHGNSSLTVFLHYYLHLTTHPIQVFRTFVQAAKRDVENFLKLYPQTKFLIRGPHVLYQGNNHHAHIGDNFAHWYERIWREEFRELMDRVWYIDQWDLTLASENVDRHPYPVLDNTIKILFGYICDAE